MDPSNPWVVLVTVVAGFTAIVMSPLKRPVLWLLARNVGQPLTAKADEIVTTVVKRELKQRNGGASLADIADVQHAQHLAIVSLETTMHAFQERLQEIGRKTELNQQHTVELVAELTTLNGAGRQGIIDRRRK